jgi:hypothetical protein
MGITALYEGTEDVGATEWSCTTDTAGPDADTTDGVFQVFLDVNDMILGDILQIRIYEKVRSADTQRLVYEAILRDVQGEPVWISPSLLLLYGWDVTLKAVSGTITVNWSIRQVI